MEQLDTKLKLLAGQGINVENYGVVNPLKLKEIISFGYSKYLQSLNILCSNFKDLLTDGLELDGEERAMFDEISPFQLLIYTDDLEFTTLIESSYSLFLNGEAKIDRDKACIVIQQGDSTLVVDDKNNDNIINIIKLQNYLLNAEDNNSFKPANDQTRKFKERLEKLKQEAQKYKSKEEQEESDIDIFDIISAVSSYSNTIDEFNFGELTIYQLYTKFKRIEMIDAYDLSIKSIMAGGQDVDLKHYTSKLK